MIKKLFYNFQSNTKPSTFYILAFLLAVDLGFIILHCLRATPFLDNPLFSLAADNGYPERFQYLKEFWISGCLMLLAIRNKQLGLAFWGLLFFYILLDDALQIHELAGNWIAQTLHYQPAMGLHPKDLGELSVSFICALVLAPPLLWFHKQGDPGYRLISIQLSILLLALVFFGIFIDMLHAILTATGKLADYAMELIEESGEMVVMSVIAQYVYWLVFESRHEQHFFNLNLKSSIKQQIE